MEDMKFYSVRSKPFVIDGLLPPIDGEPFRRIPQEVADATNERVSTVGCTRTSGGRIRFATDAEQITVRILIPDIAKHLGNMPLFGSSGLDLYCVEGGTERRIGTFRYKNVLDKLWEEGTSLKLRGGGMRTYVLYLPLYAGVRDLLIGLPCSAEIAEPTDHYLISDPIV